MENKINEAFLFNAKRTLVAKLVNNITLTQDFNCQDNEMQIRFFFEGKQFSSISTRNMDTVDGFSSSTELYDHLYEMIKEAFLKESNKDKE